MFPSEMKTSNCTTFGDPGSSYRECHLKIKNYIPEVCNSLAVTLAPNWKMLALKDFQVVLLLLQQCGSFCKLV